MPIHDWTQVRSRTYHNFHVLWMSMMTNRLNASVLPQGYFAMAEQIIGGPEPDVVTLKLADALHGGTDRSETEHGGAEHGGTVVAERKERPSTSFVMTADTERYVNKANRIVVRHELGHVMAVVEIVSPGNKDSQHAIRSFVEKTVALLFEEINLLVVDPFPPTPRDPQGIHALIWSEVTDQYFELPQDRPLTVVAYQASPLKTAYVEPTAVGSRLPTMPLFLKDDFYVDLPLEETYMETWATLPRELQRLVE